MSFYPCSGTWPCTASPGLTAGEFYKRFGPYAEITSHELGWPVSLVLAQWAIESGWNTADSCPLNGCGYSAANSAPCVGPSSDCSTCTASGAASYCGFCGAVYYGMIEWAQDNTVQKLTSGTTYADYVAQAYSSGSYTIPSADNDYGCLPGAGQSAVNALQAASMALGASGWAGGDYCSCSAGYGPACCTTSGVYVGQDLYETATASFGDYNYVSTRTTWPTACGSPPSSGGSTTPSSTGISASQVYFYAATGMDFNIAVAVAAALGVPAANVTGYYNQAYTWAESLDNLLIAVGAFATDEMYYNPCGWNNETAGYTPFNLVGPGPDSTNGQTPVDQLPPNNYNAYNTPWFVNAGGDGETWETFVLAYLLGYYALHGSWPSFTTVPCISQPQHRLTAAQAVVRRQWVVLTTARPSLRFRSQEAPDDANVASPGPSVAQATA